jgi:hypothetical protein
MTRRARVARRPGSWAAWVAVWLLVAGLGVIGHVLTFTQLSQIDEYQHVDYLDRTLRLEHVRGGEQVEELAMREQACRGIDLDGAVLPPCGSKDLEPGLFPGSGYNHTYLDPPTYYAVTGPLAKVTQAVAGLDSIVTAARAIGILWLGAGLMVTFLLARRLGADQWAAAGATLLLGGSPVLLQASATVTTDAPLLLVGGVLTLLAVGAVEGRVSPWWVALGGGAAMAVKTTSLTVVGMVGLFLLIHAVGTRRTRPETSAAATKALLLLVCGSVLTFAPWTVFTRATALPSAEEIPAFQGYKADSLGWLAVSRSVDDLLPPISGSAVRFMQTPSVDLVVVAVGVLLVAATTGLAWFGARDDLSTTLARSLLAAMVLGGPALVMLFYLGEQMSVTIPGRYGLSLLPGAAACLAVAASRRRYGGPALVLLGLLGLAAFVAACL